MNHETDPNCVCGGKGTLLIADTLGRTRVPCGECIARYDRTHCADCDKRFAEGVGRCAVKSASGELFLCEPCRARRPPTAEDFKAMVLRRRDALAAKKKAVEDFHRCRSSLDREGYAASIVAMRAAQAEEKAALAAIDGA